VSGISALPRTFSGQARDCLRLALSELEGPCQCRPSLKSRAALVGMPASEARRILSVTQTVGVRLRWANDLWYISEVVGRTQCLHHCLRCYSRGRE